MRQVCPTARGTTVTRVSRAEARVTSGSMQSNAELGSPLARPKDLRRTTPSVDKLPSTFLRLLRILLA
jgi:hypothetical protein